MLTCFFEINSFIRNGSSPSTIGEISNLAKTYSTNVLEYPSVNGTLLVFDTGTLTTGEPAVLNNTCSAVSTLLSGISNYNNSSSTIIADLQATLGSSITVTSVGNTVLNPINGLNYPVSFTFTVVENTFTWAFQVWISNSDFLANYPLGSFKLIFPINSLQSLYTSYTTAHSTINGLTPTSLTSIINNIIIGGLTGYATNNVPVVNNLGVVTDITSTVASSIPITGTITGITEITANIVIQNPLDTTQSFILPVLVAYNGGPLFCNQINYFKAFVYSILNSGTQTEAQWLSVIPSLIPVNTYYFVVNWSNDAVTNGSLAYPIYSPTVPIIAPATFASTYFPDFSPALTLENNINYTTFMYKSAGAYVIPDIGNLDGGITWHNKFPDYFLVASGDPNVGQMTSNTVTITAALNNLIQVAESYITGSTIPTGTTILTRGSRVYLCQVYNAIKICVLTRAYS